MIWVRVRLLYEADVTKYSPGRYRDLFPVLGTPGDNCHSEVHGNHTDPKANIISSYIYYEQQACSRVPFLVMHTRLMYHHVN